MMNSRTVTAVFTTADGRMERKALNGVPVADGGVEYTIPKNEAAKWKRISLHVEGSEARRGEDGYALTERGLVTHFTEETERWCPENHWMAQHYVAMKTPRMAFIGIVDSLQYEYQCWCVAENGLYRTYPEWEIDNIGEPVYEDIVYTVYELPPTADYNAVSGCTSTTTRPAAARAKGCRLPPLTGSWSSESARHRLAHLRHPRGPPRCGPSLTPFGRCGKMKSIFGETDENT